MISVLIPIYSGVEFFNECILSVFSQTYTDYEVLIGINGHPVNSDVVHTICRQSYQREGKNVRVYLYPDWANKPKTMNEMCAQAKGEYISVIDVDDLWMPDKLTKQAAFLGQYDVIGTFCRYFGDRELDLPLIGGVIPLEKILQHNEIVNSSVLVRKELFRLDEEEKMVDDYELWLRLAKDGKSFYNVAETLTLHRIHAGSKFNTLGHEAIMKHINEIKLRLHIQPIDYL